ncbi:hypothetical protein C1886_04885 [Pseudomonas sp. FW300-N1A1]|uniref:hypothetical protein n=1 Tax=Pseudomonas sp. FW300-N1A1 TaxID=2075555 RepID=UPI000CD26A92|nr:hypothetical protein [Pseudomonas sp. FW300-N1A1]POA21609.1 hypothetical protein C1886_04885 [Pseudomonas sp. FW300-N1A1]
MTAIQICALITISIGAALLYWAGYRGGLIDGRVDGEEGKNFERTNKTKTINELDASLRFIRADHKHLAPLCKPLKSSQAFGAKERQSLLDIAEKLRIAAETFSAFRTGKKLERDSLALREQALAMAALLAPEALEDAA